MKRASGDKEGLHALASRFGEVESYAYGNRKHANNADVIDPDKGVLHKARRFGTAPRSLRGLKILLSLNGVGNFKSPYARIPDWIERPSTKSTSLAPARGHSGLPAAFRSKRQKRTHGKRPQASERSPQAIRQSHSGVPSSCRDHCRKAPGGFPR